MEEEWDGLPGYSARLSYPELSGGGTVEACVLVDGHLRHAALPDLGNSEAPCLIADDDEAFTYNKRVNRLATIQEHYMIVKAIE
jgi:ParB-like chromosome segregation protein Spo0J